MSALEQSVISAVERRRRPRLRIDGVIRVAVGRGTGFIIDISESGMRARHTIPTTCHSLVRVSFQWEDQRFSATAEVLASRLASLGVSADEPAQYESRLRFRALSPQAAGVLTRVLSTLRDHDLRKWVANLRGWPPEPETVSVAPRRRGAYVRCRRFGIRWEKKWTRDASQPEDGFLLPADIDPQDLDRLCSTYDIATDDGRRLMRLIAAAVVRYAD